LLLVRHQTGDIPPLEAVIGVTAFVARELQLCAGEDGRISDFGASGGKEKEQEGEEEERKRKTLTRPAGDLSP
jgi:hypothetical protein